MDARAKDRVLRKIREALSVTTPIPFPKSEGQSLVFTAPTQELEIEFAEKFTALQGKFAFCLNKKDLVKQVTELIALQKWDKVYCTDDLVKQVLGENIATTNNLPSCDMAVTGCEYLVARTGSIVLSAAQQSGRATSVYAPVHVCIAYTTQLVYDVKDALEGIKEKYDSGLPSLITFATGPSRTADIEKTLVVGVHGPKEVFVFLVDDK